MTTAVLEVDVGKQLPQIRDKPVTVNDIQLRGLKKESTETIVKFVERQHIKQGER